MKMTRFLSLTLALLLTLALFTTALAANQNGDEANIPLKVTIVQNNLPTPDRVWYLDYATEVDFGTLTLDLDSLDLSGFDVAWNPDTGRYERNGEITLNNPLNASATLSIENRSNFNVKCTTTITNYARYDASFTADKSVVMLDKLEKEDLSLTFTWNQKNLPPYPSIDVSGILTLDFTPDSEPYPVD